MAVFKPPTDAYQLHASPDFNGEVNCSKQRAMKYHLFHPERCDLSVCGLYLVGNLNDWQPVDRLKASSICKRCLGAMKVED